MFHHCFFKGGILNQRFSKFIICRRRSRLHAQRAVAKPCSMLWSGRDETMLYPETLAPRSLHGNFSPQRESPAKGTPCHNNAWCKILGSRQTPEKNKGRDSNAQDINEARPSSQIARHLAPTLEPIQAMSRTAMQMEMAILRVEVAKPSQTP